MLRFKEHLVENEINKFSLTLDEFVSLGEMRLTDIPVRVEGPKAIRASTPSTGVPTPKEKGGNHWQKLRVGAASYFSKSPEEQKRLQEKSHNVLGKTSLLGDEASNPKLAKSGKKMPEFRTKGLTLAPSTRSGIDVCPNASSECKAACLGSEAGHGRMGLVRDARAKRTHKLFDHPEHFYAKLDHEISSAKETAHKAGQKLAVRLNVASDIPHEHLARGLFDKHKDVQFYDYTKIVGRAHHKNKPENYHLTLSSTGLNHGESNWKHVRKHLDKGGVAAMAFNVNSLSKSGKATELPTHVHDEETGKKYRIIDGDEHDHRHLDKSYHNIPENEGVIAGLKFKGGQNNINKAGNFAVKYDGKVAVSKK